MRGCSLGDEKCPKLTILYPSITKNSTGGGGGGSLVSTKSEVEFGHDKFAFQGGGGGGLWSAKTEVEFGHDKFAFLSLVSTKTEVEFGHDERPPPPEKQTCHDQTQLQFWYWQTCDQTQLQFWY